MYRQRIPILAILNEKDHQKRDNRGPGVDDQLPGFGKANERTAYGPDNDYTGGEQKCRKLSRPDRGGRGKS
jgi:hypothetical protein